MGEVETLNVKIESRKQEIPDTKLAAKPSTPAIPESLKVQPQALLEDKRTGIADNSSAPAEPASVNSKQRGTFELAPPSLGYKDYTFASDPKGPAVPESLKPISKTEFKLAAGNSGYADYTFAGDPKGPAVPESLKPKNK